MNALTQFNNIVNTGLRNSMKAIDLLLWIDDAQTRNLSYATERRELLEVFNELRVTQPTTEALVIRLTDAYWQTRVTKVTTFLTSRMVGGRATQSSNERSGGSFAETSSDSTLAFTNALIDMQHAITRYQYITCINESGEIMRTSGTGVAPEILQEFFAPRFPSVTIQSFVRYTTDDLSGTPQNNSMPTRLLRNRIDLHFLTSEVALVKAAITRIESSTTMPPPTGNTGNQAIITLLNSMDAKLNTMQTQLNQIAGPPVEGAQSFVYPITPQSYVGNGTRHHMSREILQQWNDGTLIPAGYIVTPDNFILHLNSRLMKTEVNTDYFTMGHMKKNGQTFILFMHGVTFDYQWGAYNTQTKQQYDLTWQMPEIGYVKLNNIVPFPPPRMENTCNCADVDSKLKLIAAMVKHVDDQVSLLTGNAPLQVLIMDADGCFEVTPQSFIGPGPVLPLDRSTITRWFEGEIVPTGHIRRPDGHIVYLPSTLRRMSGDDTRFMFGFSNDNISCTMYTITLEGSTRLSQYLWSNAYGEPGSLSWQVPSVGFITLPRPNTNPTQPPTSVVSLPGIMAVVRANNLMLSHMSPYMDVSPIIQQAQVEHDLKIADVEQVIEAPNERHEGSMQTTTRSNLSDAWDIEKILSRPALLSRSSWGIQPRGMQIGSASFPNDWLVNMERNTHFSNMINTFNMSKMDIVFRLVANSTAMYGGVLGMYFDFFDRVQGMYPNDNIPLSAAVNCDPVYLDLSKGTTAELKLPFSAVSQYMSRAHAPFTTQFLGSVRVVALADLAKPGIVPDVEVRLYAYLENVDVAVLAAPDSRRFVTPQASVVRTITSFAHSFIPGMKDPYPLALEDSYRIPRNNTCRVEDICGSYGLIGSFTWQSANEMDTEMFRFNIHPSVNLGTLGQDGVITRFDGPKLMHISRHFCYWNGTLEYKLQVACSNIHAGKLMIVLHPGSSVQPTNLTMTTTSNPHILLDVKENHEIEFSMPFLSPTAWKPTYISNFMGDIASTRTGVIRILNADSIKSPMQENASVTVNVFVRAGRDFQFAVPRNGLHATNKIGSIITQNKMLTSLTPNCKLNSEDFNDLYKVMRRYVPLGSPIRVPVRAVDGIVVNPDCVVIPVRPMKMLPNAANATVVPNSIGHIARGFSFWRGSLKYKIKVVGSGATAFEVIHMPLAGIPPNMTEFFALADNIVNQAGHTGSFTGSQTFHADKDVEWEVVVPYYSMYEWLHLPTQEYAVNKLPLLSTNNGCLVIKPLFRGVRYDLSVAFSVGEDFQLAGPSAFPPITPPEVNAVGVNVIVQGDVEKKPDVFAQALGIDEVTPQGVWNFFETLGKTNEVINELATNMLNSEELKLGSYFKNIIVDTVKQLLADMVESVKGFFGKILGAVNWEAIARVIMCTLICHAINTQLGLENPILQFTLGFVVGGAANSLVDYLKYAWKEAANRTRVQNGASGAFSSILELGTTILMFFSEMTELKNVTSIIKSLGTLGRNIAGIRIGADAVKIFMEWLRETLLPLLIQTDKNVLNALVTDATEIIDEVCDLNLEEMKVKCLTEAEISERVLTVYDRIVKLVKIAVVNKAPAHVMSTLTRCMTKMEKLRTEVIKYKGAAPYRIDPFHVSIFGAPGVGKSACQDQIIKDFQVMQSWPESNLVYARTADNVYWDGYQGQKCVKYDDLAQVVIDGPCDITELIGVKSNSPYMVHMADLSEKGRYFTSEFLVSTTNVKMMNSYGGLRDVKAFHRRRNVLLEMRKKQIDGQDVPFSSSTEEYKIPYAEFRIVNSITGAPTTEFMGYEDMMRIVLVKGRDYYAEQDQLVKNNTEGLRPSTVVQAIIDHEVPYALPGVVSESGDFIFTDIQVQAHFDDLSVSEQKQLIHNWTDAFNYAAEHRDFGVMVSGLNYQERLQLISAFQSGNPQEFENLSEAQRSIHRHWGIHEEAKAAFWMLYSNMKEQAARVSTYFGELWDNQPITDKKRLATMLTGLGVIAVALAIGYKYTKHDGKDRVTNEIPVEAFSEHAADEYRSKNRNEHIYHVEGKVVKRVIMESGIDDPKTRRGVTRNIMVESGIDDPKTRRGATRNIYVEYGKSPMSADVSDELLELSSEELEEAMRVTQEKGDIARVVKTVVEEYEIECDPQATTDPDAAAFIDNALLDSLCLVYEPKSTIRMKAFMLRDQFMAVPKHFFLSADTNWQQGTEFKIRVREKVYTQSFDRACLHVIPNRDLAIYLLSARVAGARDISKRIATREEHSRFRETTGSLIGLACNDKGDTWVKQRALSAVHIMAEADHLRVNYKIGQECHVLKGYRYYADTVNGECGSVLVQNNKHMYSKILGFHVAASLGRQLAYSEMLLREELVEGMNKLTERHTYIPGGTSISVLEKLIGSGIAVQGKVSVALNQLHGHIDIAAKLDNPLVRRAPGKTEICPSALQGVIPIERQTEPAILTFMDKRCPRGYDPLVGAVNKFGTPAKPFRPDHLRIVKDFLTAKYRKYKGGVSKRVLSLSEAINGMPNVDYADSINMKSAEGAFWNAERPKFAHNKEWMFETVEDDKGNLTRKISHKPLLAKLVHRLTEAQQGRRVMSVTQECLKDERRGLNKIYCAQPSTRCFTIMPVDYTILVRQYFWDFASMLMLNRAELSAQVGLNPLSIEWTSLIMRLKSMSKLGFAGDYKNYDAQEMPELLDMCCDIINAWYDDGPVNAMVRKILIQEGYDRYTMVHDALVHIDQGLPSGFPLTALMNSMINDAFRYLAWLELAPDDMKSLTTCDKHVDRISYGDDHIDAVTPLALEFYNQRTFGAFLARYGMVYTDAHKNSWESSAPSEPIEGTTFLKREFIPHPDHPRFYLAPLEKKSIEDRLLWTTSSKFMSSDELLAENIQNSMKDAYHHGPVYFSKLHEQVSDALRIIGKEKLMTTISYTSEDFAWLSTIIGLGERSSPFVRDVFGI